MKFIENYSELLAFKPSTLRSQLRHSVLNVLAASSGSASADALLKKPRIQFLYIHHIFKDEMAALENMIKRLQQHHRFISYSGAVDKILSGNIDQPYVCISSDDGFKNNLDAGVLLNKYGISACFFICPSIIGVTDLQTINRFTNERLHFPPVEFLNWNDVEQLQQLGHEIGGHTMTHINVAATPLDKLPYEIGECCAILEKRVGRSLHFAYPYGRFHHFSELGRGAVFHAGFKSCASAERGCHIVDGKPIAEPDLLIRRDHVILSWPYAHIRHFMVQNSRRANVNNNYFPYAGGNINQ